MHEQPTSDRISLDIRVSIGRLRRRLQDVSQANDLSSTQVSVLTRLVKGEANSASALAVLEGVRPQSMATTIAALEERGLVRRGPDPADGRRQIVTLTTAGDEKNEELRAARNEWLAGRIDADLTEAERTVLLEAAALIERLARP